MSVMFHSLVELKVQKGLAHPTKEYIQKLKEG
jgi:hypothetical protein